ncbi:branched-chain amino acid ABC transporter permease [Halovivax sp.]|uniref:branched-chain amino acid ABC transporter permease n=1 Tax=Halovivax sp. TaxID=1935978 RepID=UPI0025BCF6CD|nr:branched-chain amino acid ABC transporter permease [Halovivax sp.]
MSGDGSVDPVATIRSRWDAAERADRVVYALVLATVASLLVGMATGVVSVMYVAGLLILIAMYGLLSVGLNIQWGYAGLINFSVVAFFGLGAYAAMLVSSPQSPLELGWHPAVAIPLAIVVAAIVAVAIGIPTLRLRADYLAIATLGLAEVVRLIILHERQWTAGSQGISIMPVPLEWLPVGRRWVVLFLALAFLTAVILFARRIHRSPWGRAQRTIRADEDLAQALGKNTYRLKMQAFVIGSVVMSLAGVLYVFHNQFLTPGMLLPIETFYVWVALILGGTGSERGALLGGVIIVAIRQGTRFASDTAAFDLLSGALATVGVFPYLNSASLRLFLVGVLIVLVIRFRPEGMLPPRDELIWPDSREGDSNEGERGDGRVHREADVEPSAGPAAGSGGEQA